MAARLVEKAHLSAKGLLGKVKNVFKKVNEPPRGGQGQAKEITITDCLMSGLAIFKMKFPSLLQFEENKEEKPIKENLKNLFGLEKVPCDTYMRERLDEVDPRDLRPAFTSVFSALQRGKKLENNRLFEFNGDFKTASEWAEQFRVPVSTMTNWIKTRGLKYVSRNISMLKRAFDIE